MSDGALELIVIPIELGLVPFSIYTGAFIVMKLSGETGNAQNIYR